jgi:origin recognition complex subunit 5
MLQKSVAMDDPGYEGLVAEVSTLFSTNAPPFLYVNDPVSPRIACSVLESVLTSLSRSQDASPRVFHAQVNSVACFTPRIFYDSVLNQLAQWEVKWTEGCSTWRGDDDQKWNENLDAFIHGLKAVSAHRVSGKGKGKQTDTSDNSQLVIVVERAERLQDQIPDLVVPLTRLTELVRRSHSFGSLP